jgi:pimeloyl-ACP methyl ester carboxylesterase
VPSLVALLAWGGDEQVPLRRRHARVVAEHVTRRWLAQPDYGLQETWDVVDNLAQWTPGSVLDLPGWHGGRARSSPPTVRGVAQTAARWLEVTDRRAVVLVGHSTAAQSAIQAALLVAGRLSGLVLAGPTLCPQARHPLTLAARFVQTVSAEVAAELPAVLPAYLRSGGLPWVRLVLSSIHDPPEQTVATLSTPTVCSPWTGTVLPRQAERSIWLRCATVGASC